MTETATTIEPRMAHPAMTLPGAMEALQALAGASAKAGLPAITTELVHLRASQLNGCSVCVEMHATALTRAGVSPERIWTVGAWREAPYFDAAERAALALTEAVTRLADRSDPVPDEIWDEAARHYDETTLAALTLAIANINVWNRLNVATRQPAGAWKG